MKLACNGIVLASALIKVGDVNNTVQTWQLQYCCRTRTEAS